MIHTLGFLEKAVKFSHLIDRRELKPAFLKDSLLNLLPKSFHILRMLTKVEEDMACTHGAGMN